MQIQMDAVSRSKNCLLLLLLWRGGGTPALLLDRKRELSASAISQLPSVQNNPHAKAYIDVAHSNPFQHQGHSLWDQTAGFLSVLPLYSSTKYLLSIYYVPGTVQRLGVRQWRNPKISVLLDLTLCLLWIDCVVKLPFCLLSPGLEWEDTTNVWLTGVLWAWNIKHQCTAHGQSSATACPSSWPHALGCQMLSTSWRCHPSLPRCPKLWFVAPKKYTNFWRPETDDTDMAEMLKANAQNIPFTSVLGTHGPKVIGTCLQVIQILSHFQASLWQYWPKSPGTERVASTVSAYSNWLSMGGKDEEFIEWLQAAQGLIKDAFDVKVGLPRRAETEWRHGAVPGQLRSALPRKHKVVCPNAQLTSQVPFLKSLAPQYKAVGKGALGRQRRRKSTVGLLSLPPGGNAESDFSVWRPS